MDQQRVQMYIMTNQKYFPPEKIGILQEKLMYLPDERFAYIASVELKDPTTLLLISIFLGSFGVDRFMLGDTGMGVLKLLTAGCCGIMTIIDWFSVQKKTQELNFNNVINYL